MPNPRPVAALVVGTLLVTACGAGRTTPVPTAAPPPATATGSGSPGRATPAAPASPAPAPDGTGSSALPADPSASASATGATTASTAWEPVGAAPLGGSTALLDVAATGPRDAWAVGFQDGAEDREGAPAVLRWNGSRWREVTVADETGAHHLVGVSAGGPRDVWVVGNGPSAFAAHWDGRAWTSYRPFGVAEDYRLADVAASDGDAWFAANGPSGAVVLEGPEGGDGGFRNALSTEGTLRAITSRQGHVWAVGTSAARTPMVWHGRDGAWENLPVPAIPGGVLTRVWQVSPSEVWAVGRVSTSPRTPAPEALSAAGDARPLVVRWDGTRWSRVEVPVSRGVLHGVTATGPGDLWISGVDADHAGQVLVLHHDGTTWSREYGPLLRPHTSGQQYEGTDDITATGLARVPGTGTLWAVGSVGVGDDEKAFVLRR